MSTKETTAPTKMKKDTNELPLFPALAQPAPAEPCIYQHYHYQQHQKAQVSACCPPYWHGMLTTIVVWLKSKPPCVGPGLQKR
jgi:hypothetical protein